MEYKIVITKMEKNPEYREKYSAYELERGSEYLQRNYLETVLSEQEFLVVRNEVLKIFGTEAE